MKSTTKPSMYRQPGKDSLSKHLRLIYRLYIALVFFGCTSYYFIIGFSWKNSMNLRIEKYNLGSVFIIEKGVFNFWKLVFVVGSFYKQREDSTWDFRNCREVGQYICWYAKTIHGATPSSSDEGWSQLGFWIWKLHAQARTADSDRKDIH